MFKSDEEMLAYIKDGDSLWYSIKLRLGTLLRELRLEKGLSLEEVAALIDWTPKKLENMETCKRRMHWHRLAQLLKLYGKELNISLIDKSIHK